VTEGRAGFARRLNEARLAQHLSIRAVARVAGVPTATAQGWLNGRHLPAPALRTTFLDLVDRLGLTPELPEDLWGYYGESITATAEAVLQLERA
jgi:transcriptional regulator with XRE-family HTH domain